MQCPLAVLTAIESGHSWVYLLEMLTHTLRQPFSSVANYTGTVHSGAEELTAETNPHYRPRIGHIESFTLNPDSSPLQQSAPF